MVNEMIEYTKKILYFAFLSATTFLSFVSIHAEKRSLFDPQIQSVVVHFDRSVVKRVKQVALEKGNQTFIIENASANLIPESLTAWSQAEGVVIRGITTYTEKKANSLNPIIHDFEKKIAKNEEQENILQLDKKRLDSDLKAMDDYLQYLSNSISENSNTKNTSQLGKWIAAKDFLRKRRLSAIRQKLAKENELVSVKEKHAYLNAELDKIKVQKNKIKRVVEIQLHSHKAMQAELGLSYMMKNTSWNVSYGMHLKEDVLQVEYYGNIVQESGEDWNKVALSLSTSNPAKGITRSKISPQLISARKVQTKTTYIQSNENVAVEESEGEIIDSVATTTSDKKGSQLDAVMFNVVGDTTIMSGKRSVRVKIATFQLKPNEYYYRIVPSLDEAAHFSIKVQNDRKFPLLGGTVDLFRKSGYVGSSVLEHTSPNSQFQLSFGADQKVAVERDISRNQLHEGIISSEKTFVTDSNSWITNHGKTAIHIEYFERLPVSQTEEISVQIMDQTTQAYKEIAENSGILMWDYKLNPGEKKNVRLKYKVKVPEGYSGTIYGE